MKKMRQFVLLFLFLSINCKAQDWKLVWSDEFNDSTINMTNWTHDTGGHGWGNNELEYYTNRTENAKTENGCLLIIAKKESFGGKDYTSARLRSKHLRSFTYGKLEARIKIPTGQGIWPAFWMMGKDNGWPECGEIDIMEHVNTENRIYGTMHWENNGHVSHSGNISCDASKFHIYSIEWNENSIKWFLDSVKYCEGNISNSINGTGAFHLPFYFLLNVAVGGIWPGKPDSSTTFPDTMFVDYVRVYQKAAGIYKEGKQGK